MTKRIEDLTSEQWDRVEEECEKWLSIGTSTERCDRSEVERSIVFLYRELLDLPAPKFEWFDSPLAACRAFPGEEQTVRGELFLSPLWYTWTIYRVLATEITGISHDVPTDLIENFMNLMKSAGIVAPFEDVCICTERPTLLSFNDSGDLHSSTGPAVQYADGWSLYYWNGVSIPGEWIENKQSLKPETALTLENLEQRRCAAEILGWANVLATLPHRVINEDKDPMIGKLLSVDLPDSPDERFLRVLCGTGREFAIRVDKSCRTAMEAQERIHSVGPGEYKPEGRT